MTTALHGVVMMIHVHKKKMFDAEFGGVFMTYLHEIFHISIYNGSFVIAVK